MQVVNASNISQLHSHLWDAYNNDEDYEITLTSTSPYVVDSTRADDPITYNPSPTYPYGPPGSERSGLPQIRSNVTLKASIGQIATVTRDTNDPVKYRHLYVQPGGSLTLERLNIEEGDVGTADTGGGAIVNKGTLVVNGCLLGPNNRSNYGGAIINLGGKAEINDSTISGNVANWGAGIYNGGSPGSKTIIRNTEITGNAGADAGGLFNTDELCVVGCNIHNNEAIFGGGIGNYNGVTTVTESTISQNETPGFAGGGGLYNRVGQIFAYNNTIENNTGGSGPEVLNDDATTTIDAQCNWWGSATGPAAGDVAGNVDVSSYKTSPTASCSLTRAYNRNAAAEYAINLSRSNFDEFPTEYGSFSSSGMGVHGSVGSSRNYSRVLSHQNTTGSAIFISECINNGGLPMTRHPDPSEAMSCDETGSIGTFSQKGWRVCPAAEFSWAYGSASPNWRDHLGVKRYFASDTFYAEVTPSQVSAAVHFDDFLGSGLAGSIKSGGENTLSSLFNSGALATVEVGDYIYVQLQGKPDHGFLIVGWGPVLSTIQALNYDSLNLTRDEDDYPIPYVADFCFGTDTTDDGTGWLQDPRPRPFYASAVEMSDSVLDGNYDHRDRLQFDDFRPFTNSDNSRPNWQFYRIPSTMTIPSSRIYTSCEYE